MKSSTHIVPSSKTKKTKSKSIERSKKSASNTGRKTSKQVSRKTDALAAEQLKQLMYVTKPFLIARKSDVPRVPHYYHAIYNPEGANNPNGMVVVQPGMNKTLTEYVESPGASYNAIAKTMPSQYFKNINLASGNIIMVSNDLNVSVPTRPDLNNVALTAQVGQKVPGVDSFIVDPETESLVPGTAYYASLDSAFTGFTIAYRITMLGNNSNLSGALHFYHTQTMTSVASSTITLSSGAATGTLTVPPNSSGYALFGVGISLNNALVDANFIITLSYSPAALVTLFKYNIRYNMAELMQSPAVQADYDFASTSDVTSLRVEMRNETAELYKSGRCAHAQIPSHALDAFPKNITESMRYIARMQSLAVGDTPLATGASRSYKIENVLQLMNRDYDALQRASPQDNLLPAIVVCWTQENNTVPITLTFDIGLNAEYVTTSPVASPQSPPTLSGPVLEAALALMSPALDGYDWSGIPATYKQKVATKVNKATSHPHFVNVSKTYGGDLIKF